MINDVSIISDLHIGHAKMALRRGFSSVEEMNQDIITKYNAVSSKNTLGIIPGDIVVFNKEYYDVLKALNGRKIFVLGNHDTRDAVKRLLEFGEVQGAFEYKGFIITHIPIHESELHRFRANIHGHIHDWELTKTEYVYDNKKFVVEEKKVIDTRYINVNWDILKGYPLSLNQILTKNQSI